MTAMIRYEITCDKLENSSGYSKDLKHNFLDSVAFMASYFSDISSHITDKCSLVGP